MTNPTAVPLAWGTNAPIYVALVGETGFLPDSIPPNQTREERMVAHAEWVDSTEIKVRRGMREGAYQTPKARAKKASAK